MEKQRIFTAGIYRHFKGNLYLALAVSKNSETGIDEVVYVSLYKSPTLYTRPLDMFMGKVDKEKYPEVTQEYRFESVSYSEFKNNEGIINACTSLFTELSSAASAINYIRDVIEGKEGLRVWPISTVVPVNYINNIMDSRAHYKKSHDKLMYLENFGVDNWEGYGLAMEEYHNELYGNKEDDDDN